MVGKWFDGSEQWFGSNGVLSYELGRREIESIVVTPQGRDYRMRVDYSMQPETAR